MADRTPSPLDGVAPRHAHCRRCGYVFGGVKISEGMIVCAECGHPNVFELPRHPTPRRIMGFGRVLLYATMLAGAIVLIALLLT